MVCADSQFDAGAATRPQNAGGFLVCASSYLKLPCFESQKLLSEDHNVNWIFPMCLVLKRRAAL